MAARWPWCRPDCWPTRWPPTPATTRAHWLAGPWAYEEASEQQIRPWYRAAVNQDRLNREAARARAEERGEGSEDGESAESPVGLAPFGEPTPDGIPTPTGAPDEAQREAARQAREFTQSLMRDGLMVAVRTDATVFRAFLRSFNLLDPPELIMTDPEVVNRVPAAYQTRDQRPPEPALGPDRDGLLQWLGRA